MQITHGLILTSHIKDDQNGCNFIFYGKSTLGSFKLVFQDQKIVFFIPRNAEFNPGGVSFERKSTNLKNFSHEVVDTIYLSYFRDLTRVKEYLLNNNIKNYELDINPTERFLMERFIHGHIEFRGEYKESNKLKIFHNPELRASKNIFTQLTKLSLDIETGTKNQLYSIGLHFQANEHDFKKVLMLTDKDETNDSLIQYFKTEDEMILEFLRLNQELDPDILCGWHVVGFDLLFLEKKCQKFSIPFHLGRENTPLNISDSNQRGFFANTFGRIILDGPPVLRSAFLQYKNFKLETVASEVLGTGKDIASDENKVSEIERRFREDKVALAHYNILDCTLVLDIYERLDIVIFVVTRTFISGLLFDRLSISTAAFDFMYLPRLHRKGFVAPNRIDIDRDESSTGGMVIEPSPGRHHNVAVFDFKSLYPTIIMSFNIDPLSRLLASENPLKTPIDCEFSKSEFILPEIIKELLEKRASAKKTHNKSLSQSIKILMNSFYGIMGSTRSRFYHSDLPRAITQTGHYVLKYAMNFFEQNQHKVIYGDTDSIFVKLRQDESPVELLELTQKLNLELTNHLKQEFQTTSYLECEYEIKYDQIFFSQTRSGSGTAKKKYASIQNGEVEFKGMEFVRSDWTDLAKVFQKELYQKYFQDEDLEVYIKDFIKSLEMGLYDDLLIYTKRLSKAAEEYTKNIPPHVRAALKINHKGPYRLKEVSYAITLNGPEPIQHNPRNFDYPHYIEKQIRPIADDILHTQNKSFDSFRLGNQLSLL